MTTRFLSNVPDDWNSFYRKCDECGQTYHESGCDVCACQMCSHCGEWVSPCDGGLTDKELCKECAEKPEAHT